MQRILLIGTRDWTAIRNMLTGAGHETCPVAPEDAPLLDAFQRFCPDAILLELGADILILQHLRRLLRSELNTRPLPLLALARQSHLSPPQLVVGVDDFLLPPYSSEELLARLQMALWRYKRVDTQNCVQIHGLTVDLARRTVTVNGNPVALTPREYQLLQFLTTHNGRAFTREMLLHQVWGYDFEGDIRVVDAYVKRVREKLGTAYGAVIETVRGVGYRCGDLVALIMPVGK